MHEYRSEAYGILIDMPGQPKDVLPCPVWSTDGESFYLLTNNAGVLRRIAADGLVQRARLDIGRPCSWLALSSPGRVVAMNSTQEV